MNLVELLSAVAIIALLCGIFAPTNTVAILVCVTLCATLYAVLWYFDVRSRRLSKDGKRRQSGEA